MTDPEQNSAEREAESILEDAFSEIRAEECPQGKDCPVHFRVDEEYFLESVEYARLITYIGDHVVVTENNHKYEDPTLALRLVLGVIKKSDLPPRWETSVIRVGKGTLGDLWDVTPDERQASFRYVAEHDDWSGLKDFHELTVSAMYEGMIDVSKPYNPEA